MLKTPSTISKVDVVYISARMEAEGIANAAHNQAMANGLWPESDIIYKSLLAKWKKAPKGSGREKAFEYVMGRYESPLDQLERQQFLK